MTLGLVVGKFYPPHRGHKLLIDSARAQCDRLVVVLAHHRSQSIQGETRLAWLREIHPDCDVRLVPDELDDDSTQWAQWTVAYLGRSPDVVFSSEDYGPVYAGLMGSRHVMVDRARVAVSISGTAVRENPLAALPYVEPCVRGFLLPRVVLIGAESTGKTTLAAALAGTFGTTWVAEYGREHWEQKAVRWETTTPGWTPDEFLHIAQEQQRRREDLAARSSPSVLFCDTNATVTGTWYERYLGHRSSAVDAVGATDVADLYLLTDVDVPFVQDGWRDGESIRAWMHGRFVERLAMGRAPVVVVRGSWSERMATAERAVRELLARFRRF